MFRKEGFATVITISEHSHNINKVPVRKCLQLAWYSDSLPAPFWQTAKGSECLINLLIKVVWFSKDLNFPKLLKTGHLIRKSKFILKKQIKIYDIILFFLSSSQIQ